MEAYLSNPKNKDNLNDIDWSPDTDVLVLCVAFRQRLILISGLRLAQNEILDNFLCIELLKNSATNCALSCFLSILCWVAIVQVRLGVEKDKNTFSY